MRLAISGTKSEIQLIIIISVIMRTVFEVENAIRASFKLIVVVGPTGTGKRSSVKEACLLVRTVTSLWRRALTSLRHFASLALTCLVSSA